MRNIIREFLPIIKQLNGIEDNLVIGGSNALKIHGLNISRKCEDLDLIIYNPSERQKKILEGLKFFDIIKDRPIKAIEYPEGVLPKAIKLNGGHYYMDIIIENKTVPEDLLLLKFNDIYFKIQNIQLTIDAKNSYKWERQGGEEISLIKYSRSKDMRDLIDLKNMNFNFE